MTMITVPRELMIDALIVVAAISFTAGVAVAAFFLEVVARRHK